VVSIYLDAIKVLEKRGWLQGDWTDGPYTVPPAKGDGPVCLLGALAVALDLTEYRDLQDLATPECQLLGRLADGADDDRYALVAAAAWNDDESTTYEDVILLLKRAHEVSAR
jgi:hypothetical protein